jgi:hypothetical protein
VKVSESTALVPFGKTFVTPWNDTSATTQDLSREPGQVTTGPPGATGCFEPALRSPA